MLMVFIVFIMFILHFQTDEEFHGTTKMLLGFMDKFSFSGSYVEFTDGSTLLKSYVKQVLEENASTVTSSFVSILYDIFPVLHVAQRIGRHNLMTDKQL